MVYPAAAGGRGHARGPQRIRGGVAPGAVGRGVGRDLGRPGGVGEGGDDSVPEHRGVLGVQRVHEGLLLDTQRLRTHGSSTPRVHGARGADRGEQARPVPLQGAGEIGGGAPRGAQPVAHQIEGRWIRGRSDGRRRDVRHRRVGPGEPGHFGVQGLGVGRAFGGDGLQRLRTVRKQRDEQGGGRGVDARPLGLRDQRIDLSAAVVLAGSAPGDGERAETAERGAGPPQHGAAGYGR